MMVWNLVPRFLLSLSSHKVQYAGEEPPQLPVSILSHTVQQVTKAGEEPRILQYEGRVCWVYTTALAVQICR